MMSVAYLLEFSRKLSIMGVHEGQIDYRTLLQGLDRGGNNARMVVAHVHDGKHA